jgi:hypothetical protein
MLLLYVMFFLALAAVYLVARKVDTPASYVTVKTLRRRDKPRPGRAA